MFSGISDVVSTCVPATGTCTSFRFGHNTHTVRSTLAGKSPRAWRKAEVREIRGLVLTLLVADEYELLVWHHRSLAEVVFPGDTVRVHPEQALVEVGSSWLSVVRSTV